MRRKIGLFVGAVLVGAVLVCAGVAFAAPRVALAADAMASTSIGPTAAQIDAYLLSKGSPLAGQGAAFVQSGQTYGVNPALIVGISGAESTYGKYCFHPYNAWGYGDYTFLSWADGIAAVTRCISGHLYFGAGLYSVAQIGPMYDQDGMAESYWIPFVSGVMTTFGADPSDCRWSGVFPSDPTMWTVYRFRNLKNGYYLWTASDAERDNIVATMSKTWTLEGVAYRITKLTNTSPLWRFRNLKSGFYLYTSDPNEEANIVANYSKYYALEGVAYNVSRSSGSPVWRFRNLKNGTYLYTADANEKANIVATMAKTWDLEGVAYLIAP